jgi:flagellum-specific ATP synthase
MTEFWQQASSKLQTITPYTKYGVVMNVIGLTVEVSCIGLFTGELCIIQRKGASGGEIEGEVTGIRGNTALVMVFGDTAGIAHGCKVTASGRTATIQVGRGLLGRVLNAMAEPIDHNGSIGPTEGCLLRPAPISPLERQQIDQVFPTGIKVVDGLLTIGVGQRIGLFANAGVGKSSLLSAICRNAASNQRIAVVVLVGERGREVEEFVSKTTLSPAFKNTVVIAATAEQPALMRIRAVYTALVIAEFFSRQGEEVMFIADSMTRFAMALREVGLACGEPPTIRGYTSSVFAVLPAVIERCGNFINRGAITGVFSVLVEGELANDPAADAMKAVLDGHIVLSQTLAEKEHYPAIDLMKSISRLFPKLATPLQKSKSRQIRRLWSLFEEQKTMIELGMAEQDYAVKMTADMQKVRELVTQSEDESLDLQQIQQSLEQLILETH